MALFLPALLAVGLTPGDVRRSCMGEPEACLDQGWCGSARDCGAWRLREDVGSRGPAIAACQAIKSSAVEKLREGSNEAYCASKDTGLHGFRCFGGDNWVGSMASFLEAPRSVRETLDESLTLDKAGCEQLHLDGTWGGHVYMAGLCCAGWAVPCTSFDCADAFRLDTPGILRSSISIMLLIAAAVHTVSSLVCVLFGRRLLESYPSTEGMAASDKRAGQHVISMLGAAHGGFAAVLVFGALQDWLYGKIQIALVSLVWYAILGPLAEARQHGVKPWSQSHYINEFIGVASGECLSKPPKVNYIVLCICMLIAIGMETVGKVFIAGLVMVAVGILTSVIISSLPATDASEAEPEAAGSADLRQRPQMH